MVFNTAEFHDIQYHGKKFDQNCPFSRVVYFRDEILISSDVVGLIVRQGQIQTDLQGLTGIQICHINQLSQSCDSA